MVEFVLLDYIPVVMISEVLVDHSSRVVVLDFSGYFVAWPTVQLQWAVSPARMNLLAVDLRLTVVHRPLLILGSRRIDCMLADCRVFRTFAALAGQTFVAVCRMFAVLVHTC